LSVPNCPPTPLSSSLRLRLENAHAAVEATALEARRRV
jgi:hypothetical protein